MQKSNQLQDYLEAAVPAPVVLLHQRLKPFSLGHRMLLIRFGNPFVTCERLPVLEDLLEGIYICANDYDEAQRELAKPDQEFNREIAAWMKMCGEFDPAPIISEFFDYIIDGSKRPEFKTVRRKGFKRGPTPGAPYMALLFATLTSKLGFSVKRALNCPYGWSQWLYLTHLEREGHIVIEDRNFAEAIEEFAKSQGLVLKTKCAETAHAPGSKFQVPNAPSEGSRPTEEKTNGA